MGQRQHLGGGISLRAGEAVAAARSCPFLDDGPWQRAAESRSGIARDQHPSMSADGSHILTVGMDVRLIRNLWDRVAARAALRISHLVHPSYDRASWDRAATASCVYFVREDLRESLPAPDRRLLQSLERDDLPTIHNMIMSDRVLAAVPYEEVLAYATLLARRFLSLFGELSPPAIIGAFDGLHGSLALAVARKLGVPWFAMNFSTIPVAHVSCCDHLSPASALVLEPQREQSLRAQADELLSAFETSRLHAPAYLPPQLLKPAVALGQLRSQLHSLLRVAKRRRLARYRKYTDYRNSYTFSGLLAEAVRLRRNLWRLRRERLIERPPDEPFAFFGLHMQPESSIDVFAHFFSNQVRVIEMISRSLPPTHSLLVKLHKSDAPNYSTAYLARLRRFPGVRIVAPQADSVSFIRKAELVFAIQGTIGLEAALLGKPVIVFGDSPVKSFPSVAALGRTVDLPELVRRKLAEPPPGRSAIVAAFARYLAPFYPASHNDWHISPTDAEIEGYVRFFQLLLAQLPAMPVAR
jgi:Capsule polysaccharide biosynthesis protein